MNTNFTSPTFIAIATLATDAAVNHCTMYADVGSFHVTDPSIWYQDAIKVLRDDPRIEEALVNIDFKEQILSEMEAHAVFKTAFASACAGYFSRRKCER